MPVLPGAEPFSAAGSGAAAAIGVVVLHGFTGTPASVRPWAAHLAAAGFAVEAPRLPGHGTRWQDMNATTWADWYGEAERAFDNLRGRCADVFVAGLSMGGTLTLRLAEQRVGEVAGIVTVNASLTTERKDARLLPLAKWVVPSFPPIGGDIKKPGVTELAYERLPVKAAASLAALWRVTRADLGRISAPVLAFRSAQDHVVEPVSGRLLLEGIRAGGHGQRVEERVLANSFHVATLDNDAPTIFEGTADFVRETAGTPAA